jgi:hypothetical protein
MNVMQEILDLAMRLPEPQRASLARQLLLSLEPDRFDEDHEALWVAEIESRLQRTEQGAADACDWREAIDRIRQSLPRGPST